MYNGVLNVEEKLTAGTKEFCFSMAWALALLTIGKYIIFILPSYKIIGTIITILMFCVLAFFVMTRYCGVYSYTLRDDMLRVNRRIGHRNKEVGIYMSEVKEVTKRRPPKAAGSVYTMKKSVFSQRNTWYVIYERDGRDNMLVFEPTRKMAEKIKSRAKNAGA